MRTKRKGRYWITVVDDRVLEDARHIPHDVLSDYVEMFHSLGDLEKPSLSPWMTQLKADRFRRGIFRFRTMVVLAAYRGLVLEFHVERGNVLALVGMFPRHPALYEEDVPDRLKEFDL